MEKEYILEAKNISRHFKVSENYTVNAVNGVSFGIKKGEVFGLVGESGCGKSTIARILSGLYTPSEGEVIYGGKKVSGDKVPPDIKSKVQQEIQMVFQDSAAALNPRMTVEKIILEPLKIQKQIHDKEEQKKLLLRILKLVGLDESCLRKYPGELSGGQRQRVAIARSLMPSPKLIIADEPVASLDVSIQAQVITLFQHYQRKHGSAMLFIAHDLSVVRFISDRVGVMFRGKIVELGNTMDVFENPQHPYTKALISAIHIPDPIRERNKKVVEYDESKALGEKMTEISQGHFVLE